MRAQLRVDAGELCLRSRTGRDFTAEFPELADDGTPDFGLLRGRLLARTPAAVERAAAAAPATFVAFDLLHLDGQPLGRRSYHERRELLEALELSGGRWQTPARFAAGEGLLAVTRDRQLEGVVAKWLDAPYLPGPPLRLLAEAQAPPPRAAADHRLGARRPRARQLPRRPPPSRPTRPRRSRQLRPHRRAARQLRRELAARERPHRRRRLRRIDPPIPVDVDHHGRTGGLLRDPVLRAVALGR